MTSRRSRTLASSVLAVAIVLGATSAHAQNGALAEQLFREGKALMEQKKYADACPKLKESHRLDPGSGTVLLLAACWESSGKLASAWGAYEEAVALARHDGNTKREKAAQSRSRALESKLAHVKFDVEGATVPGLELRLDGELIGSAGWSKLPIDPGTHSVDVSAPGKQKWSGTFVISTESGADVIEKVPALMDVPIVAPPQVIETPAKAISTTPPVASNSPLKPTGIAIGVVGLVAVATGSVLGGLAISASSDAKSRCSLSSCTDADAVNTNNRAKTFADVSTVTLIVGGAALVVGIVLFVVAPKSAEKVAFYTHMGNGAFGGSF